MDVIAYPRGDQSLTMLVNGPHQTQQVHISHYCKNIFPEQSWHYNHLGHLHLEFQHMLQKLVVWSNMKMLSDQYMKS